MAQRNASTPEITAVTAMCAVVKISAVASNAVLRVPS
jgi:hypothetical protein